MRRKLFIHVILASVLIEASGCAGTKPIIRGQSPERRIEFARLRRRFRRDVEPVLDATCHVGNKVKPAWDATKDVTRKGLVLGGMLALLGGSWWLWNEEQNYKAANPFDPMFDPTLGNSTPP